jgi:3-oxoacyl-[acyl-carrier protein] reductase
MRMQDKVVLITGGAKGIGKATALLFSEEGAKVITCDVDEAAGLETIKLAGNDAAFYKVDVSDRAEVQRWIDHVTTRFKRVDVLINNAGIIRDSQLVRVKEGKLIGQMSEKDFDLVVSVNLKGTFNCAQAIAPVMIKQGGGVILNAASIVGLDGNFGQTNYVATKSGVIGMTKVWARELGRYGVRVNAVAPGFITTDILSNMPENVLEGMKARTLLGRLGVPREIANAYLFLASDEAAFITGAILRVDGGIVVGT